MIELIQVVRHAEARPRLVAFTMKADLRDFTLCAADSANIALTVRAFNQTLENCNFGNVLFFTHAAVEGPFRTVKIDKLTRQRYRHFRLKEVTTFIDTPFVLFIEWDGYVTGRPTFFHN